MPNVDVSKMDFSIAIARSHTSKTWKAVKISWADLVEKFKNVVRTEETFAEYSAMTGDKKTSLKSKAGAFVGGRLAGTVRSTETLLSRCLLTLDIDSATPEQAKTFKAVASQFCSCIYTTHSHSPEAPRYRFVAPLGREVSPSEYVAICEYMIEEVFGICGDIVDSCSTRPAQIMFLPTASQDGAFECVDFRYQGEIIDPDDILGKAKERTLLGGKQNWEKKAERLVAKQANPLEKPGVIGEFCRAFSIVDVLTDPELLGDKYEPTDDPRRFKLSGSHSVPGVLIYPYTGANGERIENVFMYSHHAKDPTCNKLCNAFDAYRLHKFGDLETEKSLKEAIKGISDMPKMQAAMKELRRKQVFEDFEEEADLCLSDFDTEDTDEEWREVLTKTEDANKAKLFWEDKSTQGAKAWWKDEEALQKWKNKVFEINEKLVKRAKNDPRPAVIKSNFDLILAEDPVFSGLRRNVFLDLIEVEGWLPWRNKEMQRRHGNVWSDSDLLAALSYIARKYKNLHNKQMLIDSIEAIADKRAYHPITEKLDAMPEWDGVKRAESIFIDYLGAEDTPYVRAVTMKTLQALAERVNKPGRKYDYMVILDGPQGIGKTTMFERLSLGYYTNDLSLQDMGNLQKAMEQTQGCWIVEVTELAGAKKAEVEFIKAYVSRTVDRCRKAYGRFVEVSPRQFVLVGTTNESSDYLRDHTGNRRFYPIHCAGIMGADGKLDIYYAFNHFTKDIICQVWAEVLQSLKEEKFDSELPADLRKVAEAKQESMTEKDERTSLVQKYVDMLVPTDWDTYDDYMKTKYTQQYIGADFSQDVLDTQRTEGADQKDRSLGVGTEPMKYVKIADIWQYVFLEKMIKLDSMQTRMIAKILKQCGYESKVVKDPATKKTIRVWIKADKKD